MSNPSHFSGPMNIGDGAYEKLNAAKVLTAEDSGKVFDLFNVSGFAVTLPKLKDVKKGFEIQLRVELAPTGAAYLIQVDASNSGLLFGNSVASDALAAGTSLGGGDSVSFAATAAVISDRVQIRTDGNVWHVHGQSALAAGIIFA